MVEGVEGLAAGSVSFGLVFVGFKGVLFGSFYFVCCNCLYRIIGELNGICLR